MWHGETIPTALYLLLAPDEILLDVCKAWAWIGCCVVMCGAARVNVSDSAIRSASAASTVTMKGGGAVMNRWPPRTWNRLESRSDGSTNLPKTILCSILCCNRPFLRRFVFPIDSVLFSAPPSPSQSYFLITTQLKSQRETAQLKAQLDHLPWVG